MAVRARSRVASLTVSESLRTADTVALDTPADAATSLIVGRLTVMTEHPNGFDYVRPGSAGCTLAGCPTAVKRPGDACRSACRHMGLRRTPGRHRPARARGALDFARA